MLRNSHSSLSPCEPVDVHDSPVSSLSGISLEPSNSVHVPKKTPPFRRDATSFRRIVVQFWLTEWLAWLFALGAIIGIVIVLMVFNGKAIPDWPFGITLGALVSLLATLATVALMVPVTAGISQARWVWFTRERLLRDFELINNASRSPIGSVWLLFRWTGGHLAITGALLAIAVLGVNPFAQQVVSHAYRQVETSATSIPVTLMYDTYDPFAFEDVTLSMKAAIQRGVLDVDADQSTFYTSPQCPTTNCTWRQYSSLSVCAECADLSNDLTVSAENTTSTENNVTYVVHLTNNITTTVWRSIDSWVPFMFMNSSRFWPSIKFEHANSLLDVYAIVMPPVSSNGPSITDKPWAVECVLEFCVRNFTARSVNGVFSETPSGEVKPLDWSMPTTILGFFNTTVGGQAYLMSIVSWNLFMTYFERSFMSVVDLNKEESENTWPNDASQSTYYWMNKSSDRLPTKMFENIAASMDLNMRTSSNESSPGVAYSTVAVVSVNWYWMIPPFTILVLVLLYLIGVILVTKTKGLRPWKSSSLAPLMHGLIDSESRRLVSDVANLEDMEALAERLLARTTHSAINDERSGHVGIALRERL